VNPKRGKAERLCEAQEEGERPAVYYHYYDSSKAETHKVQKKQKENAHFC